MLVQLHIDQNCVNKAGVIDGGPAHGRADANPEHCQMIILQSGIKDTEEKFKLGSLDVGTMGGCAGEIVEILTRRKVNVCSVQEIRWRGASAWLITRKDSE